MGSPVPSRRDAPPDPLVIVAVVVAYVVTARLTPLPAEDAAPTPAAAESAEAVATGSP